MKNFHTHQKAGQEEKSIFNKFYYRQKKSSVFIQTNDNIIERANRWN